LKNANKDIVGNVWGEHEVFVVGEGKYYENWTSKSQGREIGCGGNEK